MRLLLFFCVIHALHSTSQIEIFKENGKFGLKKGAEILLNAEYELINYARQKGFVVMKNNKQGILDSTLRTVLPIEYELIVETELSKGIAFFVKKENFWGAIDQKGKFIIPLLLDYSHQDFVSNVNLDYKSYIQSDSYIIASINNKYGVWDVHGKKILSPNYESIIQDELYDAETDQSSPLFIAIGNGKFETFDTKKKRINSLKVGKYLGQNNEKLYFKEENQLKYIDLVDLKYKQASDLEDNIPVKKGGYYGLIDKNGNFVIEANYDKSVKHGCVVEKCMIETFEIFSQCKQGFINNSGDLVLKPIYYIEDFYLDEHIFVVRDSLKQTGIVNKEGKIIAPIIFEDFDYEVNADESKFLILLKKDEDDSDHLILLSNQQFFLEGKLTSKTELYTDFFITFIGDELLVSSYSGELISKEILEKK